MTFSLKQLLAVVTLAALGFALLASDFRGVPIVDLQARFSPGGRHVAVRITEGTYWEASLDGINCCFVKSGKQRTIDQAHTSRVELWDSITGGLENVLERSTPTTFNFMHVRDEVSITFSADGTRLAAVTEDGMLGTWQIPSGRRLLARRVGDPHAVIHWLGNQVVVEIERPVGHPASDQHVKYFRAPPRGNLAGYSPDGLLFATTAAGASAIQVFDVAARKPLTTISFGDADDCQYYSFVNDELLLCQERGTIDLWNARTGTRQTTARVPMLGSNLATLKWTVSQRIDRLVIGGRNDARIRLHELPSGKLLRNLPSDRDAELVRMEFSPDGQQLLETRIGEILLRDISSGEVVWRRTFRKLRIPWQIPAGIVGLWAAFWLRRRIREMRHKSAVEPRETS